MRRRSWPGWAWSWVGIVPGMHVLGRLNRQRISAMERTGLPQFASLDLIVGSRGLALSRELRAARPVLGSASKTISAAGQPSVACPGRTASGRAIISSCTEPGIPVLTSRTEAAGSFFRCFTLARRNVWPALVLAGLKLGYRSPLVRMTASRPLPARSFFCSVLGCLPTLTAAQVARRRAFLLALSQQVRRWA